MLQTRLYFAGSAPKAVDQYVVSQGWSRLFSQLNDRSRIEKWMQFKDENPDLWLFIDSGAFSAYTKGVDINLDDYINYMNTNGDYFNVMVQVDTIPGKTSAEQDVEIYLKAPKLCWDNFLDMRSKLRPEIRSRFIPVYHEGEDWQWLDNMLSWVDPETHEQLKYIGIAPHMELSSDHRRDFGLEVYRHIKKLNPEVKTHAFGMTALDVLKYVPYTSVDSTTWLKSAIYGGILVPRGKSGKLCLVSVGERTTNSPDHFCYKGADTKKFLLNLIESYGFDVSELATLTPNQNVLEEREENITNSIAQRQMFNAKAMMKYLEDNDFIGAGKSTRRLVASGGVTR